ncbi:MULTISPECIES: FadR/GntR family transcriptional regulator [Alphaproteobacteria]|uniref:GntR family transcriptional regulator n=2 Tax=Alphaproteobacteria TaxID=28211 RepID=A0A512HNM6_9HYPH|nr:MULTISPECIES: GntR family transcriptional regulator [Alphaproteobacteria]GEO87056.1 GntR family transcriptional regulator [Ciceribacter naphthalenivorans]GLR23158.1 GntR family transcriptional regulator [Ciceribacter naphthalenivorans]GLT06014.1 GntR family transcriptional regulator [Sphingomonas psychrolutea]
MGSGKASFKPVGTQKPFELVCERVREKLLKGELKPGDRLPHERELAEQLCVSRQVVREALRSLEIAGVVTLGRGVDGASILPGEASRLAQALGDLITLNSISVKDLYEARILILELVLDQIGRIARRPDVSNLEALVSETRAACRTGDMKRRRECGYRFYHELAAMTGNTALVFTVDAQTELIQGFMRYRVADMPEQVLLTSREIFVRLLKEGEIEAAKIEIRAHLSRVHACLRTLPSRD